MSSDVVSELDSMHLTATAVGTKSVELVQLIDALEDVSSVPGLALASIRCIEACTTQIDTLKYHIEDAAVGLARAATGTLAIGAPIPPSIPPDIGDPVEDHGDRAPKKKKRGFFGSVLSTVEEALSEVAERVEDFGQQLCEEDGGVVPKVRDPLGAFEFPFPEDEARQLTGVAGEIGHRFAEYVEYVIARTERRMKSPIQSWIIDDLSGTGAVEQVGAAIAILALGGEFDASIKSGEAEFIVGVETPLGGALTIGHSVLVDEPPDDELVEHEMVHVKDIERVGGYKFYKSYILSYLENVLSGDDPSPGGDAYHNIFWEERAYGDDHVN